MKLAVLFGGMSSEHEISLLSAAAMLDNLDMDRYEVFRLGITKKGRWLLYPGTTAAIRDGSWEQDPDNVPAFISPDHTTHGIVTNHAGAFDVIKIDLVLPALHGRNGEDGTVQGLLDLSGIPYVGCGVLCSAVCMHKATTNLVFEANAIPHTPWMAVSRSEISDFDTVLFRMRAKMGYPVVVKPAVGGSSIGVTKATNDDELRSAVLLASAHDDTILLEKCVDGHEVECAVLGNGDPLVALPGEIVPCNDTYDYEAKYHSGDASKLYIPARLPQEKLQEVRQLALRAYKALGCRGLARVDFFIERETGQVLLNEINTLPGFTSISMYPKLMQHAGISFTELLNRLILCGMELADA